MYLTHSTHASLTAYITKRVKTGKFKTREPTIHTTLLTPTYIPFLNSPP